MWRDAPAHVHRRRLGGRHAAPRDWGPPGSTQHRSPEATPLGDSVPASAGGVSDRRLAGVQLTEGMKELQSMDTLFLFATAVATSISACIAWTNIATSINVNIRQRDNGDYSLGLYLEQHSGRPARDVVVHIWVDGKVLPPFGHPSMKTGQSIQIGVIPTAGGIRWYDAVRHEEIPLRTLRVEAEFSSWWRRNGYAGRGKALLDMRDGDALQRSLRLHLWDPESRRDRAIREACEEHRKWARYRNEAERRRLFRSMQQQEENSGD